MKEQTLNIDLNHKYKISTYQDSKTEEVQISADTYKNDFSDIFFVD